MISPGSFFKLIVVPFIMITTSSYEMQSPKTIIPQIESILKTEIKRHKTPSVSYAVFTKDSLIYSFSDGYSDIFNKKMINEKTTYNILSVTKTFTALAILQLSEQKLIDINLPIKKYLPEFAYSPDITIKQILNHSSGIPNPVPLKWIHLVSEHPDFDRNKYFSEIIRKNSKNKFGPNEKYQYSNLGYFILGQLIEKVSYLSYEEYINKYIINKLGLKTNELSFLIHDTALHAKGYIKKMSSLNLALGLFIDKSKYMDKSEGKWKSFNNFYVNGSAYGGLISTQYALIKYLQELLKPNCALLNDECKSLLFAENNTNSGKATKVCLAWFTGYLNGNKYYAHAGGGGGYYCEIRIYPEINIGSVILFNRTGISDERFLDKVDKYVLEKLDTLIN